MYTIHKKTHAKFLNSIELLNFKPIYTNHAIKQSKRRKIRLPEIINIKKGQVIEADLNFNKKITKLVVRFKNWQLKKDLTVVLVPNDENSMVIKTVWLNNSWDYHHSLDYSKYDTKLQLNV